MKNIRISEEGQKIWEMPLEHLIIVDPLVYVVTKQVPLNSTVYIVLYSLADPLIGL